MRQADCSRSGPSVSTARLGAGATLKLAALRFAFGLRKTVLITGLLLDASLIATARFAVLL